MVFSLFDHPHFSTLLRHDKIATLFSPEAELSAMLRFEEVLAQVEAELDVIPKDAAAAISAAVQCFEPSYSTLADGVCRDGVIGPSLVKSLRETVPETFRSFVHFGATSQDVVDTGLVLRLRDVLMILRRELELVVDRLSSLSSRLGTIQIMGRTRMQRALPIAFRDRVATWQSPLARHLDTLDRLEKTMLAVQFGGAVGTLHTLGTRGAEVRNLLAQRLGLIDPGRPWHAERDRLTDLASWLANVSGSIGKIGQDLTLMAQNEVGEAGIGSGLSSAMPHKRNPVQAEILISLARFNACQTAAVYQSMIHEAERSGAAWTLEWLIIPEMTAATASSLMIMQNCLDKLTINKTV